MPANHTAAGLQVKIDMSIYDEYQIVITEAQRRLIVRALTNALANDRRSSDLTHPIPTEWMQLIRLFSTIEPSERKAMP
jgi:hypothetical protein